MTRRLSRKQKDQMAALDTVDRGVWATGILLAAANVTYDMLIAEGRHVDAARDFVDRMIQATPARFGQEIGGIKPDDG